MKFKYLWPEIYHHLFSNKLLEMEINEVKANCKQCSKAKPQYKKSDFYLENLKCCTFQPFIPNFAIGAILSDNKSRYLNAQKVIKKNIESRAYMLPVGMVAPIRYQMEYTENKKKIFGRDASYLCSFFDKEKNHCGAWEYRGAVCTSYYCVSSYGLAGKRFWNRVSQFQTYIEIALMEECMVHLGYSPRQLSDSLRYIRFDIKNDQANSYELKSWVLQPKVFDNLWGDFRGNIQDYYKKCYEHVISRSKNDYNDIIGELGHKLESNLLKEFELL